MAGNIKLDYTNFHRPPVLRGAAEASVMERATVLTPTLEDYLEAIYHIESEKRVARPRDICSAKGVSGSTVTAALRSLSEKGLVNYEPYDVVTLTDEGLERAERIVLRHRIIQDFLENILGLEHERASSNACEMEHAVDEEALERFVCFLAFVKRYSPRGDRWLSDFRSFVEGGAGGQSCRECVEGYIESLRSSTQGSKEG